jgi:hypothetical protein
MSDELAKTISIWVTQYLAGFCLVSLLLITGGRYLWMKGPDTRIRDLVLYLASISALTLILTFSPFRADSLLWPPITWFCLTMLFMLELLWVAYVVESALMLVHGLSGLFSRKVAAPVAPPHSGTPYSRL